MQTTGVVLMNSLTVNSVDTGFSGSAATTHRQTDRHMDRFHFYHRLNGSSSPALMATSLSYVKTKNSTAHRIKTPDPTEKKIWHGWLCWLDDPRAKFYVNLTKADFSANRWNIRKNFSGCIPFFFNSPTGQNFQRIFACDGSNDELSLIHISEPTRPY